MAVEFAWLDQGEDRALSDEYDRERDIVLRGKHHGYLVLPKSCAAESELRFEYASMRRAVDDHPLVGVRASFWGMTLITDSLFPEPSGAISEDLAFVCRF